MIAKIELGVAKGFRAMGTLCVSEVIFDHRSNCVGLGGYRINTICSLTKDCLCLSSGFIWCQRSMATKSDKPLHSVKPELENVADCLRLSPCTEARKPIIPNGLSRLHRLNGAVINHDQLPIDAVIASDRVP
jgi:hypothetical protein